MWDRTNRNSITADLIDTRKYGPIKGRSHYKKEGGKSPLEIRRERNEIRPLTARRMQIGNVPEADGD